MGTNITRKHFIWMIIILTVINISAIGTIFYHSWKDDKPALPDGPPPGREIRIPEGGMGRYFMEELDLSPEQHQQFRQLRRQFHREAGDLTMRMQIKRNEMITEMAKPAADTAYLNKIAEEIGEMHAELKRLTIDYYLGMKEACTPEQQKELYKIFNVIINRDEFPERRGERGRRRF